MQWVSQQVFGEGQVLLVLDVVQGFAPGLQALVLLSSQDLVLLPFQFELVLVLDEVESLAQIVVFIVFTFVVGDSKILRTGRSNVLLAPSVLPSF